MAYSPNANLPDSQEGLLQAILIALNQLVANNGLPDPLTRRVRVAVESTVALPANQSSNVAQWAGTNGVTGIGASAAGAPRVTPSNDTVAGIGAISQTQQAWANAGLTSIYSNITVS